MFNMLTHAVARIRTGLIEAVTPQCNTGSHDDDLNDEVTIAFRLADIDLPEGRRPVVSLYARRMPRTDVDAHGLPRESFREPPLPRPAGKTPTRSSPVAIAPSPRAGKAETAAAALWSPPAPPPLPPTPGPRPSRRPEPTAPSRPQPLAAQAPDRAAPALPPAPIQPEAVEAVWPQAEPAVRTSPSPKPRQMSAPRPAPPRPAWDVDTMLDGILDTAAGRRRGVPTVAPARPAPREITVTIRRVAGGIPSANRSAVSRTVNEMGIASDGVTGRDWRSCAPGLSRPDPHTGLAHSIGDLGVGSGW